MFLKSVSQIQEKESHARWSITFTEHQAAVTKVCGLLFLVQISCWTPYSVLCLWTTVLPPETLNVYFTLIPSIACKVSKITLLCSKIQTIFSRQLSPILNATVIWWNLPRFVSNYCIHPNRSVFRVTAGYFYLKRGRAGQMPSELFDYKYVPR